MFSKIKVNDPEEPLFLVLLGTDVLERIFGNVNGFDNLEMLYCIRASSEVMRILDKHQGWTKDCDKTIKRLSLDYSKPSNWKIENLTLKYVNIQTCWDKGRTYAKSFIQESECDKLKEINLNKLCMMGNTTSLKPHGEKVQMTTISTNGDEIGW